MATAKKKYGFDPDYAIPPGETLLEVIDSLNMTQKDLALRTGLTVQSINRIIKGDQPITYETANRLELTTGVPARMWNNLEAQYREQLAKISEQEQLKENLSWLKEIPVRELAQRGLIANTTEKTAQLREVLKFYGVSSVDAWHDIWANPKVAARRSKCFETCPGPASAWIRQGEVFAHAQKCGPYSKREFTDALSEIRGLTTAPPATFVPKMKDLCARSGVAFVMVKEMKKVPWRGATKWLAPNKAMILLNLRGKSEDQFWFSFFHEAGHVLNDSKKDLYINDDKRGDEREALADKFAADFLIPSTWNNKIKAAKSKAEIISLSNEIDISKGIVVGRYHHLTKNWKYFNGLKRKFEWE